MDVSSLDEKISVVVRASLHFHPFLLVSHINYNYFPRKIMQLITQVLVFEHSDGGVDGDGDAGGSVEVKTHGN